jgi:acyl-CoA thioesterase-1
MSFRTRKEAGTRPLARLARAGFAAGSLLAAAAVRAQPERSILFFGDSLTAGYGLADPGTQSFPAIVQAKIDAAHLAWHVVNAGLSGETSAGGLRRIDWVLRQPVDAVVLELGGNDGLRGTPPGTTRANLQGIIDHIRAKYPAAPIVLAGMRMPASMGADYAEAFQAIYPSLAAKNGLILIPFLLEGVGGRMDLNQGDGIHPTQQGAAIVADLVWKSLEPALHRK